ncbi:MAG: BNR repeat-containing protein [Eubacteriales bacterium]
MALPIPPSGRAVGQLIAAINDGPDEDSEPQIIPARGEASFTATVSHVPVPGAEPNPYTLVPRPRTGVFDENGFLCTPRTNLAGEILLDEQGHPLIEAQGVKLTANEIDGTSVENWTWSVSLRLTGENGKWLQTIPAFSLPVPAGGEVDITKYMGVPATVPIGTAQAFLLVDQAEQHARAASEAAADQVALVAGSLWAGINGDEQPITFDQFPIPASGVEQFNSATIAQDNVTTAPNGDVYSVYWDANREPRIAARVSALGTYVTASLAYSANNPLASPVTVDSHNNIVIAVDGDGFIHVSGNHHGQALRYMRSANPYDIASWEQPVMIGAEENSVTYPQFVRTSDGDLLFFYRNGVSGNGDHYLNRYSRATRTWSRVSQIFKGTAPVSPDQCAYINRVSLGADGSLHVFYMWRETTSPGTNRDLSYIKSTDGGVTWQTVTGDEVQTPITPENTAPRIIAGNPGGLVNQSGSCVDSSGNPHTFFWLNSSEGSSSKRLHHIHFSAGEWHNEVVADSSSGISRATGYALPDGRVYAVFKRNGCPTALRVQPSLGEEVTLFPHNLASWEPSYDSEAPAGTLRMLLSPAKAGDPLFSSTYAGILSVDMLQVDNLPADRVVAKPQSVALPGSTTPVSGTPMASGRFYTPAGARSTLDGSMPSGDFRGAIYTAAEEGAINKLAVNVVGRAGVTGVTRLAAYSIDGDLLAVTEPIDTSTTGVKVANTLFRVGKGRSFIVGAITYGSTSPSFMWLDGSHDFRVGSSSANSAFSLLPGLSFNTSNGVLPLKASFNGTSKVPLVSIGVF